MDTFVVIVPESVTLRLAGSDDAAAMRELVEAAYRPYVARIGQRPAPMAADYASIADSGRAWVAEQCGRLVGLLVLVPAGDHLLLDNVAVDPDAQGVGVGSLLLRLAEEQAQTRGFNEVRLYTNVAMTENLTYYPRHGYLETHRATQDGYQRVFFTKPVGQIEPEMPR